MEDIGPLAHAHDYFFLVGALTSASFLGVDRDMASAGDATRFACLGFFASLFPRA